MIMYLKGFVNVYTNVTVINIEMLLVIMNGIFAVQKLM